MQRNILNTQRVQVYNVELYNLETDGMQKSRRMATKGGAEKMGGTIIPETCVLITSDQLENGEEWTALDFKASDANPGPF